MIFYNLLGGEENKSVAAFLNAYHVVWFNTLLFDCNVFIGLDFCLVLFADFIMITLCFIVELYLWFIYYIECNEMPYCIQ